MAPTPGVARRSVLDSSVQNRDPPAWLVESVVVVAHAAGPGEKKSRAGSGERRKEPESRRMTDRSARGLSSRVKRHSWYLVALWTGCVGGSLVWNLHEHRARIFEIARNSAQVTFENDILYRKWAARQGGVYVKGSEKAPPNPFLRIPDRDVTTTTGTSLT